MLTLVLCAPGALSGHEFWIDPVEFQPAIGENVVADLRVGEDFKGGAQPFLPRNTRQMQIVQDDKVTDVVPTIGDRPAFDVEGSGPGLVVLVHATSDSILTYREFAKFERFVRHKDAAWTIARHLERDVSEPFREAYSRYAKSLVAVGDGSGADTRVGLVTELVALENPYTGAMSDGIDVALFYDGKPRKDAQIEVFERAVDGNVMLSTVRTDDLGRATVSVRPGNTYMLDAVVLREPDAELAESLNAVWESLWANLTFYVPE